MPLFSAPLTPRALLASVASLLLALAPTAARANGRFPAANQLVLPPGGDSARQFVRTTFGLLTTMDSGASYRWMCERVVGFSGSQDPAVMMMGDGALVVALFDGLVVSHDGGCSFARAPSLEGQYVIDVALDKGIAGSAIALTSSGLPGGAFYNQVFETKDDAKTWSKLGVAAPDDMLSETLESAPSRPQRIYLSGFISVDEGGPEPVRHGVLEVSDDRAESWTRHMIALDGDQSVYIAAVDPLDHERLYARTRGSTSDRLLLSVDGGESFVPIAQTEGSMLGFALSPDGERIAIGGPSAGVWVASKGALSFEKVSEKKVSCLTWGKAGLFACGNGFDDGFVIGLSGDDGASFSAVMPALSDVAGQVSCAASAPLHQLCDAEWASLRETLGIADGDGGLPDGDVGPDAAPADDAGQGRNDSNTESSGCGCAMVGASGASCAAGLALALGVCLTLSRIRNRRTA